MQTGVFLAHVHLMSGRKPFSKTLSKEAISSSLLLSVLRTSKALVGLLHRSSSTQELYSTDRKVQACIQRATSKRWKKVEIHKPVCLSRHLESDSKSHRSTMSRSTSVDRFQFAKFHGPSEKSRYRSYRPNGNTACWKPRLLVSGL